MIGQLETFTFVINDFDNPSHIQLFDYFDKEEIKYEVLELSSTELPHRDIVYYPVLLNSIDEKMNYFDPYLVNPRALALAQEQKLVIIYIYTGLTDIVSTRPVLMTQIIDNDITINDVRVITSIRPASTMSPFIYFPFEEMESYLAVDEESLVKELNTEVREKIFTCNVTKDTAHARLFCASIWYHALHHEGFLNYTGNIDIQSVRYSSIAEWKNHWSSISTLSDMFGLQLPMIDHTEEPSQFFSESYWNFVSNDSFNNKTLSLTEKAFGPIANLQPFVIIGPMGSMKLLESLGYKTFGEYVNEIYDQIQSDEDRMQALFRLVYEMAHYDDVDFIHINENIHYILKHNQTHFLSSKRFRLVNLLEQIKIGNN